VPTYLERIAPRDLHLVLPFIRRLADPVLHAVRAFIADPLDHLGVGGQLGANGHRPRPRVRLRIGEGHFDVERAERCPAIALRRTQCLSVRMAVVIEPGAIVEAVALDDERVTIPAPDGIAHPAWIRCGFECASVQEDLPVRQIRIEDHDQRGRLDDLHHLGAGAVCGDGVAGTERQTPHVHVVLAEVFPSLLDQRARPRLNLVGLQVGGGVA
jgi:hypothetical protein